jgi:hypothetical protein
MSSSTATERPIRLDHVRARPVRHPVHASLNLRHDEIEKLGGEGRAGGIRLIGTVA